MCNCEYCIPCVNCGHKADEHIAGEGHCFICKCPGFTNEAADAWDRLNRLEQQKFPSFQDFVDKYWIKENETTNK